MNKNNNGNALFIILIAIGLFAALAQAVMNNNRISGESLSVERARIDATEANIFLQRLREATDKLRLVHECTLDELTFDNDVYEKADGTYNRPMGSNVNARPDFSCHMFHFNGGAISPYIVKSVAAVPVASDASVADGHGAFVSDRQVLELGSEEPEGHFVLTGLSRELCIAYNDLAGVENPGGEPPVEVDASIFGDEAPELVGKRQFCHFRDSATKKRYAIFFALYIR